jgi:hypothetical protein
MTYLEQIARKLGEGSIRNLKRLSRLLVAACLSAAATATPASDCYDSSIVTPSPFLGNHGEIFKLSDGSLWEVKFQYEYLYAYHPQVLICPSLGMIVVQSKKLNVEQVGGARRETKSQRPNETATPALIETSIAGEFKGWSGDTIFRLANGQVWQQASYAYMYMYAYGPRVMIIRSSRGFEMHVDGATDRILVKRLN